MKFLVVAIATALIPASLALASSMSTDFEPAPGGDYSLFDASNGFSGTAVQSTDVSHSSSHSIKLQLSSSDDNPVIRMIPTGATLGDLAGSFWVNVPSSSPDFIPYMIFGVTTDNSAWGSNPSAEALVIVANSGFSATNDGTWYQSGMTASSTVHVEDARDGLGATDYTISNAGTLAALRNESTGSQTWGSLTVQRAYVEAGLWPGVSSYTAYVDDMNLTVPEPASIGLLLAAGGLMTLRRRRTA